MRNSRQRTPNGGNNDALTHQHILETMTEL